MLIAIVIEDERGYEISIYKLVLLFLITLIKIFIYRFKFSLETFLLANALYLLIYLLAKGSFGLGDVILNGILALNFFNTWSYFKFFTLTFCLGSLISLLSVYLKKLSLKSRVPFAKYIVMAYLAKMLIGGYFV